MNRDDIKKVGEKATLITNVPREIANNIWNTAIEAAALELERLCRLTKNNQDETTIAYSIDAIRKLKK